MKGEQFLTEPQQYASVYARGRSWVTGLIVMRAIPNHLALSRYGFSVSKRVGNAVVRNKMKRRLREILRVMPLRAGWDIVFIVRPAAATADFTAFKSSVKGLLSRSQLLASDREHGLLAGVKVGSGDAS